MSIHSLRENDNELLENILIIKSQQRFISEKYSVFTEEFNLRLHWMLMMTTEYNQLIQKTHMHMEQVNIWYV